MAGVAGFEPAVHATKKHCLTTWLHPNNPPSEQTSLSFIPLGERGFYEPDLEKATPKTDRLHRKFYTSPFSGFSFKVRLSIRA